MDNLEFKRALFTALELSAKTNSYFQESRPWEKVGTDECNIILYSVGYAVHRIAMMLSPFVPEVAEQVRKEFGFPRGYENIEEFEVKEVKFMLKKIIKKNKKAVRW